MQLTYSLSEIQKCSLSILIDEESEYKFPSDLVKAAKYCWQFISKRSDYKTTLWYIGVLWNAALWDLQNNNSHLL